MVSQRAYPTRQYQRQAHLGRRSTWLNCRDNPQHSGQFLWCGIDYLGESRSWPLTVFNGGLLDRAGFVQPRGLERQSWWSDKPMVLILRSIGVTAETPADPGYKALEWQGRQVIFPDWNPTASGPHDESVEIYSNAAEVELFLKDKSLGKKATRKDGGAQILKPLGRALPILWANASPAGGAITCFPARGPSAHATCGSGNGRSPNKASRAAARGSARKWQSGLQPATPGAGNRRPGHSR